MFQLKNKGLVDCRFIRYRPLSVSMAVKLVQLVVVYSEVVRSILQVHQ